MPKKSKDKANDNITIKKNAQKIENIKSKKSTSKNTVIVKSQTDKITTKKISTNKNTSFKGISAKNSVPKKVSIEKNSTTKKVTKSKIASTTEYYDLPYRYNETIVKILAQTPTTLFIYWDISDSDKASYIQKYGEDFFYKTKPILKIKNNTLNYSFEVEINDFANSWYLHVNDANCDYSVELARRPISDNSNIDNYIYVAKSNNIEMPNNHILFERLGSSVFFKNIKNNFNQEIPISSLSYIKRLGNFYNIYEAYKEIYKDDINMENLNSNNIKLDLSSSNSSTFI